MSNTGGPFPRYPKRMQDQLDKIPKRTFLSHHKGIKLTAFREEALEKLEGGEIKPRKRMTRWERFWNGLFTV